MTSSLEPETPVTGAQDAVGGRFAGVRGPRGRFVSVRTAMERFLDRCEFDPITGCVIWVGGKTRGRGKTSWYGSFWAFGRMWKVHRWVARFVLGLEIDGLEVDHKCGNTLCVRHLQVCSGQINREMYWIRVQVGLEPAPEEPENDPLGIPFYDPLGIPFYDPPEWFRSRMPQPPEEPPF